MIDDYKLKKKVKYIDSIDFLLFQYFSFSYKSEIDDIFFNIVSKAYRDAVGEGAFNTLIKKNETKLREEADKCREETLCFLGKQLKAFGKCRDYRTWHTYTANSILGIYSKINTKSRKLWSFGNSQKIINMSVKYLLLCSSILVLIKPNHKIKKYSVKFESIRGDLDIPVDSFMIEALWNEPSIDIPYNDSEKINHGKYGQTKYKSWSNWDFETYKKFQESYHDIFNKKRIIPLDWEGIAWMNVAKERRK